MTNFKLLLDYVYYQATNVLEGSNIKSVCDAVQNQKQKDLKL